MNEILLQRREVEEIFKLVNKFDVDYITVKQGESNGIGCILSVEIPATLNETVGTFVIEVSNEDHW